MYPNQINISNIIIIVVVIIIIEEEKEIKYLCDVVIQHFNF